MPEPSGASALLNRDSLLSGLVRLGRLDFSDFRLLEATTVARVLGDESSRDDWRLALNNAPHILVHFRRCCSGRTPSAESSSLSETRDAQDRLVRRLAGVLLRAKAPPLHDALPWNGWDFTIVAKRVRLWQTKFFLCGDGTSAVMHHCRRSAGVCIVETSPSAVRYLEKKGLADRTKRLRVLCAPLAPLPLPDQSFGLAIAGSLPDTEAGTVVHVLNEITRVAAQTLVIENNPLSDPLDDIMMTGLRFRPDAVPVRSLGLRRCWWKDKPT